MDPTAVLAQAQPGGFETSATERLLQYGVIGILCIVFAIVIRYLYRENRVDRKEAAENEKKHAAEMAAAKEKHVAEISQCREQCRTEKEAMRADHEKRHREILEGYTAQLVQMRAQLDKREDDLRRGTEAMIEKLANGNRESSEALVEMLQQFLNKVVK